MMRFVQLGALMALAISTFAPPETARAEVRLIGSTTVAYGLVRPHESEIEQLVGDTLSVLPSSTSRGLADLVRGTADIAMLAEPLESAARNLNRTSPGLFDPANYVGQHVGNALVQFIVHPSNPVRALTRDQLAGLFSGRIRNWSEVGGADLPVLVVGEPSSSPHWMVRDALGIAYAPELRVVQNTNQLATVVAQAQGAISYLTSLHAVPLRSSLAFVDSEIQLPLQLYLAFHKDAPEAIRRVVDAVAAASGR